MDTDILKGFKISLGIIFGLSLFLGIVFAVGFHTADEILGGTFIGNYVFQGNVKLNNSASVCNLAQEGSIMYNNSILQVCNGTAWKEVSLGSGSSTLISDPNTLLALQFDNDYSDSSTRRYEVTGNPGSIISGKFGNSVSFDGTSEYLFIADPYSNFAFGTNDWTIDAWVKCSPVFAGGFFRTFSTELAIIQDTDSEGKFRIWIDGNNPVPKGNLVVCNNNWNHIAIVSYQSTLYTFVNGALDVQVNSFNPNIDGSTDLTIGKDSGSDNHYLNGEMDEIRISNVARWTSPFTPPTGPYS